MGRMNEELRSLCSRLCQKADLEARVTALEGKRKTMASEVKKLARAAKAEQRDITRLERPSFAALVHHLAGDLEARREAERREAGEARIKYEAAARELAEIETQLQDVLAQLAGMEDARERYVWLLEQKHEAIKAAGGADADKIAGKEHTLSFLDSQLSGIREALAAGKTAWSGIESVLSQLDTAALRTVMHPGKGLVNDLAAMSSSLPEAQSAIYALEKHITAFEKKLALTPVRGKLNFRPEEITVRNPGPVTVSPVSGGRIQSGKDKLEALQQRIAQLLEQLRREREQLQKKRQKAEESLEKMIVSMDWRE